MFSQEYIMGLSILGLTLIPATTTNEIIDYIRRDRRNKETILELESALKILSKRA